MRNFQRQLALTTILVVMLPGTVLAEHPTTTPKHSPKSNHARMILYRNSKYGFSLVLPASWKGYTASWSRWEGSVFDGNGELKQVLHGPELRIRHPKWTEDNPREDLPVMIFTIPQWRQEPIVSAAPFGAGKLGRNRKYVFGVPPRWDYDFAEGWEEAGKILTSLHTFEPAK